VPQKRNEDETFCKSNIGKVIRIDDFEVTDRIVINRLSPIQENIPAHKFPSNISIMSDEEAMLAKLEYE
jgi:hypothetical protein